MKEILTTLGMIVGLVFFGFQLASPMLMRRRLNRIASLPTDELKALFADSNYGIYLAVAAKTLQELRRKVDEPTGA